MYILCYIIVIWCVLILDSFFSEVGFSYRFFEEEEKAIKELVFDFFEDEEDYFDFIL